MTVLCQMREIRPSNNNGSIILQFSVSGRRYRFNPIPGADFGNRRDMASASAIATKIQNDILAGCFDKTLDRYRLTPKDAEQIPTTKHRTVLELWDSWVCTLDISLATKADHYEMIRRMIAKAKPGLTDTSWLTKAELAPATFNKRLSYVKSCFQWAIKEGKATVNPFDSVKPKKATVQPVKPFTAEEMRKIVAGFEAQAPHYVPFVRFLFLTGVRLSEAIGLRYEHVDFSRGELVIAESLSKDRTGNGYSRVRKATKTGSVRHLKMTKELRGLLQGLPLRNPDDLVFLTPKGYVIDSGNFRETWKDILGLCAVPYRKPHAIRHTMLSHAVEQGTPLTGVAYLAGHANTRMVMMTYGHMVNRPSLPDMPV